MYNSVDDEAPEDTVVSGIRGTNATEVYESRQSNPRRKTTLILEILLTKKV